MSSRGPTQTSLTELGTPLHEVTFVVVDLETTGGSPSTCGITEVGAVKVHGGERVGELATLVDPQQAIPPEITALTGITQAMTARHPPIEAVLPMLLEFLHGGVLVAHNARFDVSFLAAAAERLDYPPLRIPVVDTAALARRLVREEVRDCRLATLARHLRARTVPTHRALADARATVDVLHALLERAGSYGVTTLEDLIEAASARSLPLFRSRASMADHLPRCPGVYAFRGADGELLYVGKATDLRSRVRRYFGNDRRRFVAHMVRQTVAVDHWATPTPLEAAARELRLLHAHRPRYNRRDTHPERAVWLKLTTEPFPRLSVVRQPRPDGAAYLGPLPSRQSATGVVEAIHEAAPIRRCTDRIGPRTRFPACLLAELGRCGAPCEGRISVGVYEDQIAGVRAAFAGDPSALAERLRDRMTALGAGGRFEQAARLRDGLAALLGAVARARRLAWIQTAGPLTAVRRRADGRAEVVAVRGGAVVASDVTDPALARQSAARLHARVAFPAPCPDVHHHEQDLVARWLEGPGVVVLRCDGRLDERVAGGAVIATQLAALRRARRQTGRPGSELKDKRTRRGPSETSVA